MAFKTLSNYSEQKYGNRLVLQNDGDSAQGIFLYRSLDDVLVADAHYIKSPDYSGYVHCLGANCPACAKGIRKQTKVFIPFYRIDGENPELVFWERNTKFIPQLQAEVFNKFPNPSEYVFTITRHGVSGDINTRYAVAGVMKSTKLPYDAILSQLGITFPDAYGQIIEDMDKSRMYMMLSSGNSGSSYSSASNLPEYTPMPRVHVENINAQSPISVDDIPDASPDELPDDVDFD